MARQEFIRGTRSTAPYGYSREGVAKKRPGASVLAWTLVILLLSAMAIFSWLFPAYVFRNPHIPFNYELLRKIGKLDDIKVFSATRLPPQRDPTFFTARELFARESGRPADQLAVINELQLRLYVQNYATYEAMLGFITGDFEVIETRKLGKEDLFPGLALRARSEEFPNTILEYLLPVPGEFDNPYEVGHRLKIKTGGDLAAILHLERLPRDRLSVSAIPLTYADRAFPDGRLLDVESPRRLNLRAEWPVFGERLEEPQPEGG